MKLKMMMLAVFSLALVGCGGGGGSSATMGPLVKWAQPNFKSWNATSAKSTFVMDGQSVEVNTQTSAITGNTSVESVTTNKIQLGGTTSLRDDEIFSTLNLVSGSGTQLNYSGRDIEDTNFNPDSITLPDGSTANFIYASSVEPNTYLEFYVPANSLNGSPDQLGLDFMTFGYWDKYDTQGNLIQSGHFAAGNVTPSSSMPLSGTASYSGAAVGRYYSSDSIEYLTGNVSATAFWGSRDPSMNFDMNLVGSDSYSVSGSLKIDNSTSSFAGRVGGQRFSDSDSLALTGPVTGKFYGSRAQEIGGTFNLKNDVEGHHLVGSFGAKQ